MALSLTIGGIEYISKIDFKSIKSMQSREVKGSNLVCTSKIYDGAFPVPRAGAEIIWLDGATREFGGVITDVKFEIGESNRLLKYSLTCSDYTFYFDRRYINKIYSSQRADLMAKEILDDLQALAGSLDTHYNDFQGDKSNIDIGPVVKQQRFERVLPSQAMDVIAEGAGMEWWVDFNKVLNLRELLDNQATFLPEVGGISILRVDDNINDFFDLELEESILSTGTKSIIQSAVIQSTAEITDEFDYVANTDTKFKLLKRPFSLSSISSVKIDGGGNLTQRADDFYLDSTEDPETGECAIYVGSVNGDPPYVRLSTDDLSGGETITVTYKYNIVDDHETPEIGVTSQLAARTGGDGVHEFLFSQASEIQVTDFEHLDTITQTILARKAKIHLRGKFNSFTKGWEAGQTFTFIWEALGLEEEVYIVNLRKQVKSPFDDPNLGDNLILSTIEFSNIPRTVRL